MRIDSAPPLIAPLPDPTLWTKRQTLVLGLVKYVTEVQEIENGYSFRFRPSQFLARRLADYLLFESRVSPQLSFVLVLDSNEGGLWLQIRGPGEAAKAQIRNDLVPSWPSFTSEVSEETSS